MLLNPIPITHQESPESVIDIQKGVEKFGGNMSQFKSMLNTFDKITIDMGLQQVYQSIVDSKKKEAINQLKQIESSAKIAECVSLAGAARKLLDFLSAEKNEKSRSYEIQLENEMKEFVESLTATKQSIQNYTQLYSDWTIIKDISKDMNIYFPEQNMYFKNRQQENMQKQQNQAEIVNNFQKIDFQDIQKKDSECCCIQ